MADRVIDLDHVAIALRDVTQTLTTLVRDLGARVLFGGANLGFRAMQVDCGGMRIELLEPWNVEANDFLERFLDANGDGAHHLTFKTDDIRRDLENVREAGYHPVGINIDNPYWREAFLHPKEACGTVVQIAESDLDPLEFDSEVREYGPSRWWPDVGEPAQAAATLGRVVVTTDEMTRTLELYDRILGGRRQDWGEGWVELAWPTGGRIRIEHAAGRPGGIDRLEWTHSGAREERRIGGTTFVFDREDG